jgi:hypothetical protein
MILSLHDSVIYYAVKNDLARQNHDKELIFSF